MTTQENNLSTTTKLLHGIIAISMICMMIVGIYMSENEVFFLYPIHKSFGAILFIVALIRVIWRIKQGWPSVIGNIALWQQRIARAIHWLLITLTVLYPLSGLMMSIGGGHGLSIFGLELVAATRDAAGDAIAVNKTIGSLGHELHETMVVVLFVAIILHVLGALKHHFIDKDHTLKRMFSK